MLATIVVTPLVTIC